MRIIRKIELDLSRHSAIWLLQLHWLKVTQRAPDNNNKYRLDAEMGFWGEKINSDSNGTEKKSTEHWMPSHTTESLEKKIGNIHRKVLVCLQSLILLISIALSGWPVAVQPNKLVYSEHSLEVTTWISCPLTASHWKWIFNYSRNGFFFVLIERQGKKET